MTTTQTDPQEVRFPDVQVQLTGHDGNAYAIMGAVQAALKKAGVPREVISEYLAESTAGDYDNLIRTAMRWVEVS
jgi:hypothetical protein